MRRFAVLAATLALAACAGDAKPPPEPLPPPLPPPPAPPPPAPVRPPRPNLPPAPISVPPPPSPPQPDQCGAYLLTGLIGKPRTSIPVPIDPFKRRVVCSSCPVAQDYRPDRLTITYDAATGRITKVACN